MKNKSLRTLAVLLAVMLCMAAFSVTAYAGGGDESYYTEPTESTEPTAKPEQTPTAEPGTPFTEDGNLVTRDLLFDKATNKQYITVETKNGHTFYIVIDYDKPIDEDGEQYYTYFLNLVDEADLLAVIEDKDADTTTACTCSEKCTAGKVNTACPVCKNDMTNCMGAAPQATEPEETEPEESKSAGAGGLALLVLIVVLAGGAALWYFKLRKPKVNVKGTTDLDAFDFDEDDEDEADDFDLERDAAEPDAEQEDDE